MRRRLRGRLGLRSRLIAAFLLVAAISAAATATLTYREARSTILQQAQDSAVAAFRDQIAAQHLTLPMTTVSLRQVCTALAWQGRPRPWIVFGEYGKITASSSDRPTSGVVTAQLRQQARTSAHGSFQRVVKGGTPWLTVGMPVMFGEERTNSAPASSSTP